MRTQKPRIHRLKSLIQKTSIRCIALLTLITLCCVMLLAADSRRSSEAYVASLAASMDESLGLINSTLNTVSRYLSVYDPLVNMSASSFNQSTEDMERIYDLIGMTSTYSDIIQDLTIVSKTGHMQSFYNTFAFSYIDQLKADGLYDFSDSSLSQPQYFFFPNNDSRHDPMFIYLFPLISTNARASTERAGTVVLACGLSTLQSILTLDLSVPYQCSLLDDTGREILSSAANDYALADFTIRADIPSDYLPLTIRIATASGSLRSTKPVVFVAFVLLLLVIAYTILSFSRVLRRNLQQPIEHMVKVMPNITLNANHEPLPSTHIEELDIIVNSVNHMIEQLESASLHAIKMETQLLETRLRNNEAELYALQSQINPHFLFNTLQCIRSLAILHHADDISTVCSGLSAMLRYSIREMKQVTVREEVNIILQYLKIIDIRYQNRFTYDIDVPESVLDYSCPCMIIQPLVENAVLHGVSAADNNGFIRICGRISDQVIHFEVFDDGVGISESKLQELQSRLQLHLFDMLESHEKYGKSFGLLNIQRRIQLQYGEEYGLTLSSGSMGTKICLRFPAIAPN
ncbi:MAG: histidine kinase [Clostridia bacterium]|nr:histidine kinase [Clostridia bacterium]